MADLISPVAAWLYYFLIYNEIIGSKRKGFVIIYQLLRLRRTLSGISCSPHLKADTRNRCLSKETRICGSLESPTSSFSAHSRQL